MKILAIETSCDETGLALIESAPKNQIKILANLVSSQTEIHRPYGGVVPNLAKREHIKNLQILWEDLTKNLKLKTDNLDLIAVTQGPGLAPCLWAGINFAADLAKKLKKPLVGINHLKGHVFSAFIQNSTFHISHSNFPVLSLIVSGGHTELVYSKKLGHYKIIGETLDDAAGECFDKVARLLGLGYPGGPEIAKIAQSAKRKAQNNNQKLKIKLPRPMINSKDYNFSFSGLKTAVLYLLRDLEKQKIDIEKIKPAIAREFQDAVVEVLIKKTIAAAKNLKPKTIVLGGGVAANKNLREKLEKEIKTNFPATICNLSPNFLTGDNALIIALAALAEKDLLEPTDPDKMEAKPNWRLNEQ